MPVNMLLTAVEAGPLHRCGNSHLRGMDNPFHILALVPSRDPKIRTGDCADGFLAGALYDAAHSLAGNSTANFRVASSLPQI